MGGSATELPGIVAEEPIMPGGGGSGDRLAEPQHLSAEQVGGASSPKLHAPTSWGASCMAIGILNVVATGLWVGGSFAVILMFSCSGTTGPNACYTTTSWWKFCFAALFFSAVVVCFPFSQVFWPPSVSCGWKNMKGANEKQLWGGRKGFRELLCGWRRAWCGTTSREGFCCWLPVVLGFGGSTIVVIIGFLDLGAVQLGSGPGDAQIFNWLTPDQITTFAFTTNFMLWTIAGVYCTTRSFMLISVHQQELEAESYFASRRVDDPQRAIIDLIIKHEAPPAEPDNSALIAELEAMKPSARRKRAVAAGATEDELEEADDDRCCCVKFNCRKAQAGVKLARQLEHTRLELEAARANKDTVEVKWLESVEVALEKRVDLPNLQVSKMELERVKAEVDDMGRVVTVLFGPFLAITALAGCLVLVVFELLSKPDGTNHLIIHNQNYSTDYEWPCRSAVGYTGTISGLSANFLPEGYVFMFVTMTVQAIVVLKEVPPIRGFPMTWSFWTQCMLIRLGMGLTTITAMVPDFAEGRYGSNAVSFTKWHVGGIGLGIMIGLIATLWYTIEMLIKRSNRRHQFTSSQTVLHVGVIILIILVIACGICFSKSNEARPPYPSYWNICLHRNPVDQGRGACALPAEFDKERYSEQQKVLNPATGKELRDEYTSGMRMKWSGTSKEPWEGLTTEWDQNDTFLEKTCHLSMDGTLCIDRHCHFKEFSVNLAWEFALLELSIGMLQGFVFMTHIDRALGSRPELLGSAAQDGGRAGEAKQADQDSQDGDTHVVSCECVPLVHKLLTCKCATQLGSNGNDQSGTEP